jgi:precorrin-2 dehydrogenase/sirohydrochlorin ferrochelatase
LATQPAACKRLKAMLIDLDVRDKTVLIIGGGKVGERKATKFLAAGAKVIVASRDFTDRIKRLSTDDRLQLVHVDAEADHVSVRHWISKANLVIAATNNQELNKQIAEEAKKKRTHISVVDNYHLGDFVLPVTSRIGEINIAISTGGKSPAIANILQKKVEAIVTEEDILLVRLQSYARELAKRHIANQESRRKALYKIIGDRKIRRLLKRGNFQEAKNHTRQIIKRY